MRVEFSMEGGIAFFPGLSKPVEVDVDRLDKDEASRLRQLVEAAHFFDLPTAAQAPLHGAADYQYSVLTIDDGARKHTVRVTEPIEDPALDELVHAVRELAKAARAAKRAP
jgi:hypothetical protein